MRATRIGMLILAAVVLSAAALSSRQASGLSGSVRAMDGKALEGVAISARAPGSSVTTSVFADERGEYVFPALTGGEYAVWAQATGFATARATLTLSPDRATRQAFTLSAIDDVTPQLTASEWLAALPEETKEQRRLKAIFRTNCTACHGATHALQNRFDENGWRAVISFMERNTGTGGINRHTTVVHYKDELAKYLASVRGPQSPPLNFKLDPRPTGDAARVVITEYDVPLAGVRAERAWHDGGDWSQGWPTASMGARWIHDIIPDDEGNAWGTRDRGPADMTLFKIDATSGQVTGFSIKNGQAIRRSHSIAKDQQGIIWFDGGDGPLGRLDPKTESFEMFVPPLNMGGGQLTTVDVDAQGKIWGATQGGANRFDPVTKTWKHFTSLTWPRNFVYGTAGDAEGNGWWTQYTADRVVKADPRTGRTFEVIMRPPWMKEEDVTTPADREWYESMGVMTWGNINTVPHGQQPRRLGADKRGEFVWVPNNAGNNLARINIRTLETKYYPVQGNPYFVTVDRDSNVWTNLFADARVAKFNPRTERWTLYTLPSRCESRNIAVDNIRGDVWVPCANTSRVIRLQFRVADPIAAAKAGDRPQGVPAAASRVEPRRNGEAFSMVPTVVREDYDMRTFMAPLPLDETQLRGRTLFAQRCANCHRGTPPQNPGPLIGRQTVARVGESGVREKIRKGSLAMPGYEYSLQPPQIDQLVAFLKTFDPPKREADRE